ncbi:hypothetical protein BK816_02585 [Boudabousia tangfeifanii]|uniref:ATP-binding protein n=1 Tax=Boudabousia tangfeifanii TaxID=1912795 RepID=A0A1D9MJ60_9ACTO|nr:DUF3107 domain-containing protein [Boudabousia tangfeifanii]AOZ72322.1 hypothetical protein BK816_02585 [Boudabousia tangfeifanii]
MELKIGLSGVARELNLEDVELSADELKAAVAHSLSTDETLELKTAKEGTVLINPKSLAYVEIVPEQKRTVGFGLVPNV